MSQVRRALAVALAASAALTAVPAAEGAVQIGDRQVVVQGRGARAVIDRAPLRIAFQDGAGRTVLQQVQPGPPQPTGGVTPEPLGFDAMPEPRAYAPFAFEVGGEQNFQHPGGLYTGNMLVGARAGLIHTAANAVRATPRGEGVELEVTTTDPSRTMFVIVEPDHGAALRVRARVVQGNGVSAFSDSFGTGPDEAFRGFGGRHNAIDQRGNDFYNWIEEEFQGPGPGLEPVFTHTPQRVTGGDRYQFPNGPTAAYYVQNVVVSSRPYALLVNQTELTRWKMASDRPDAWQVVSSTPSLDYTVAVGEPHKSIRTMTEITGRHRMNPEWAMGPILKRNVHQGNDEPADQRRKIEADIKKIKELKLKLNGYIYESWDTVGDDFARRTNRELRSMGIRPIGYVRAYINDDGNFDPEGTFEEGLRRDHCTETAAGTPYVSVAVGPACLLDFTKPWVVDWWKQRKIRRQLDLGFQGFMQDFGEQALGDMRFHNGETGLTMHNKFPSVFHGTTRRIVDQWEREHPDRGEVWMYVRSGFSGRPGTAAIEHANFPGDMTADWTQSSGLPAATRDMLNRAAAGAPGYTVDIGGYFDTTSQLTKELLVRYMQWAALSPFFRLHNSCCSRGTRMPWDFDGETLAVWRAMSDLHLRARPLTRDLWREFLRTGIPVTRPLWLAYPDDREAAKQDQQWLLGPDVLVAPVVHERAHARSVYFPRGCWEHPETDELHRGPGYARVNAPLGHLPYFFRCGTNPFASGRGCLARRSPIGPRNIGRVRLGYTRTRFRRRLPVRPLRRTRASWRWCVKRSSGRVSAVFAGKKRRSVLVTTTARAHGNRGARPGRRSLTLRRAYPRRKRVARGLYRANPRSPRLIGVRRERIRYFAVVDRKLLRKRSRRKLRRYLQLAGVEPSKRRRGAKKRRR